MADDRKPILWKHPDFTRSILVFVDTQRLSMSKNRTYQSVYPSISVAREIALQASRKGLKTLISLATMLGSEASQ